MKGRRGASVCFPLSPWSTGPRFSPRVPPTAGVSGDDPEVRSGSTTARVGGSTVSSSRLLVVGVMLRSRGTGRTGPRSDLSLVRTVDFSSPTVVHRFGVRGPRSQATGHPCDPKESFFLSSPTVRRERYLVRHGSSPGVVTHSSGVPSVVRGSGECFFF